MNSKYIGLAAVTVSIVVAWSPLHAASLQDMIPAGAINRSITLPPGTYVLDKPILLSNLRNVTVEGSGVTLKSNGKLRQFIQIIGVRGVRIHGLHIEGMWSATRPSDGDKPAIIVGSLDRREDRTNEGVEISDVKIIGADWAGILVYGRYGSFSTIKNYNISIHDNDISNSSIGIFVYKNARNIKITRNNINMMGQDGIAIDSRAQSDATQSEPNYDIQVTGNIISGCGYSAPGIGIVVKGNAQEIDVADNRISHVGDMAGYQHLMAIGIGVVPDFSRLLPSSVSISNNIVAKIWPGSINGHGILIAGTIPGIALKDNALTEVGLQHSS